MAEFATLTPVTLGATVPLPTDPLLGTGSPEGVVTAGIGRLYTDSITGAIWVKTSGSGNTGWRRLDFGAAADPFPGLMGPVFNVKAFGAIGDGVADDRASAQVTLDAVETTGGGIAYFPKGDYAIGPSNGAVPPSAGDYSLKVGSGVMVWLAPGATLIRRFAGGGVVNATVRNKDLVNGNSKIEVLGGGVVKASNSANTGHLVGFQKSSLIRLYDFREEGVFGGWNNTFVDCDDVIVSRMLIDSGTLTTEDGVHFVGGSRLVVADSVIRSGDDCVAFTQEAIAENPTKDILDVLVSNCYLESRKANGVRVLISSGVSRAIRRVAVSNCSIKAGDSAYGIEISDGNAPGLITDLSFDNVPIDASVNGFSGVRLSNALRVDFAKVKVRQPNQRGFIIDGATDVSLDHCGVDTPRTAGMQAVLVANTAACTNVSLMGGHYKGATEHGIILGSGSFAVTDGELIGVRVEGSTNNGIRLRNCSGVRVHACRATGNGQGLEEVAPSDNNVIVGNDFRGNTGAGINALAGASTECGRNLGVVQAFQGRLLEGVLSPAALASGNTNNYNPAGLAFVRTLRLSADAAGSTLTGIATPATGGRSLRIINVSANTLTLAHQDVNSSAANRLISPTGVNVALAADDVADLEYDVTTQRWRIVNMLT